MIKWLKKKIKMHNDNLNYSNYKDYWEFGEWMFFVLITFFLPLGMGIFLTFRRNNWFYFILGIIISIIAIYNLCCQIELFSKNKTKKQAKKDINAEELDPYRIDNIQFIWGIKSWDDLSSGEPNLYTMNDLDITYNKDTKLYYLSVETVYHFDEGKIEEVKYLNYLLAKFTGYMKQNNLNINAPYDFWVGGQILLRGKTIPELYTQFRIFVAGYNAVYGGVEDEIICDI